MSTVLVADDDRDLLAPVCDYISRRDEALRTLTASSGSEGIEILQHEHIDLVLSDLRMPDGDGIDILAYLSSHVPPIPVIVMSGFVRSDAAEALSRFGRLRFLSKPARLEEIFEAVEEGLQEAPELGSLCGFSLASVLQLVEMEGKSCRVEVHGGEGRSGSFTFAGGCLHDVRAGGTSGEDAAFEMLNWECPRIRVHGAPHGAATPSAGVDHDVMGLLMRSMQMRDEGRGTAGQTPDEPPENPLPGTGGGRNCP